MNKVYTKRQYIPTMLDIFEFVVDLVGFRKEKTILRFFLSNRKQNPLKCMQY